jgi:hypothetical protein
MKGQVENSRKVPFQQQDILRDIFLIRFFSMENGAGWIRSLSAIGLGGGAALAAYLVLLGGSSQSHDNETIADKSLDTRQAIDFYLESAQSVT